MHIYSLKDVKAGTYSPPMTFLNRAVAIRSLAEAAQQPDTMLHKHGADYQLYELGEFDVNSAKITLRETPDYVITVSELLPPVRAAS